MNGRKKHNHAQYLVFVATAPSKKRRCHHVIVKVWPTINIDKILSQSRSHIINNQKIESDYSARRLYHMALKKKSSHLHSAVTFAQNFEFK